jgi:hypothetical protein
MGPQQALQMLGSLRGEGTASQIISSLRIGAYHHVRQQASNTAGIGENDEPAAQRSSLAVELEIRHPFAYPPLLPIDLGPAENQLHSLLEGSENRTQQIVGAQPADVASKPMPSRSDGTGGGVVGERSLDGGEFNRHPELYVSGPTHLPFSPCPRSPTLACSDL